MNLHLFLRLKCSTWPGEMSVERKQLENRFKKHRKRNEKPTLLQSPPLPDLAEVEHRPKAARSSPQARFSPVSAANHKHSAWLEKSSVLSLGQHLIPNEASVPTIPASILQSLRDRKNMVVIKILQKKKLGFHLSPQI